MRWFRLLLLLGFIGVVPVCSATLLQHTSSDCVNTNPCTLTIPSTTAGSLVSVGGFVVSNSATATTITGCGGTWQTAFSFPNFDGHREAFLLYLPNVTAGCTSLTINFPLSIGAVVVELEHSGVLTSTPLDAFSVALTAGTGTCISASRTPTSGQNELFIGLLYEATNGSQTWTGTSGWTVEQQQGNNSDGDTLALADQTVASTTGSYTLSGTVTPGTNSRCAFATFINAGASASGTVIVGATVITGPTIIK